MSFTIRGHKLNRRQMDAINPLFNKLISGRVTRDGYEQACVDAMKEAGCPLGYPVTMPGHDAPVEVRAAAWRLDGFVGSSSLAIHDHMLGLGTGAHAHPLDPDDLNRCLLLLDLIPEWSPRMGEMASISNYWKELAGQWEAVTGCFLEEAGLDWCKSDTASQTYAMMKSIIG